MSAIDNKCILVVDDDPQVLEAIVGVLRSFGHTCRTATNGSDALNLMQRDNFDIAICDFKMPDLNGLELLSRAQKVRLDLPFLIITGLGEEYTYEQVVRAGARDFIKKPFSTAELSAKLDRILKECELEEENRRLLRNQVALNERLSIVLSVASHLSSELDIERLFPLIIHKVTEAMGAERSSLYIIDWEHQELWTKVAEEIEEIRLPLGEGISGRVAQTGETINVDDAWKSPYFKRDFDLKHGFRTRSVLCMPLNDSSGARIGVIQVLNKIERACFDELDETLLKALTGPVSIALENSLLLKELEVSFESSIRTLSATVDARHPLTAGHSQRVTELSLLIAKEMKLNENEQEIIKYAALLHDIGKIGIRDGVLLKQGPFTLEERVEIETHAFKTRSILEKFHFPKVLRQVPEVATYHHEKINGRGYPEGLKGDELPLGSKILAVADVFDALTSGRDYPKYHGNSTFDCEPMPVSRAISLIKEERGRHFEPSVVDAFMKVLSEASNTLAGPAACQGSNKKK